MQARFAISSAIAMVLAAATPAFAGDLSLAELLARGACPELPICGSCSADSPKTGNDEQAAETEHDRHVFVNNATEQAEGSTLHVGSANGGVWRSQDSGASATPSDITTAPAEGRTDYLLDLGGVEGEASAPAQSAQDVTSGQQAQAGLLLPAVQPPRRDGSFAAQPEQGRTGTGTLTLSSGNAQTTTDGLLILRQLPPAAETSELPVQQAQDGQAIGLLVPAVQQVRSAASRTPQDDGVVVLDQSLPQGAAGGTGTGTLTLSNGNAAAEPQQQAEEPQRPRRRFSLSIGGVTLSNDGGVSVAVGDIDGDSHESNSESAARRVHSPVRTTGPTR